MTPSPYTPETLLPAFRALFDQALARVPPALAGELRPMRSVFRHASRPSVLTWRCWLRSQRAAGLPPQNYQWCIIRDPHHFHADHHEWVLQWSVHLGLLPGEPAAVQRLREFLQEGVRRLQVPGFTVQDHPREPRVFREFPLSGPPAGLAPLLAGHLATLWQATFPLHQELVRRAAGAAPAGGDASADLPPAD
ncbi:MAG: hypothetical protein ACKOET_04645 [Verrucomicrobiota bacterium]